MDDLIEFLDRGHVGTFIGFVLFIIGVAVSYYFYRRSRSRCALAWQWQGVDIIGTVRSEAPDGLRVQYQGRELTRVSSTEIVLWNNGTTTIRGSDIVPTDPLRIAFGVKTSILHVQNITVTRPALSFKTEIVDQHGEVQLGFDFLDPGDGARFRVYHTGHQLRPSFAGTIKGLVDGLQDFGNLPPAKRTIAEVMEDLRRKRHRISFVERGSATILAYPSAPGWSIIAIALIALGIGVHAIIASASHIEPTVQVLPPAEGEKTTTIIVHSMPELVEKRISAEPLKERYMMLALGIVYLILGIHFRKLTKSRFPPALASGSASKPQAPEPLDDPPAQPPH